jgi:uncharacterized membrane protein YbhN (UPF0104 family)
MKRLVSIGVSLGILGILYALLDWAAILNVLAKADPGLLALSLVLLVGLILASGFRLHLLARYGDFVLSFPVAMESTFAANAVNLFLPGKLGDLLKAVVMTKRAPERMPTALALGVWEKLADLALLFLMAALPLVLFGSEPLTALVLSVVGLAGLSSLTIPQILGYPLGSLAKLRPLRRSWTEVLLALRSPRWALPVLLGLSAAIWCGHLLQIAIMAAAIGVSGSLELWVMLVSLLPVAIVAGLVPLTFAGVGVRDAALVVLLSPLIGSSAAAALGILFWLRYLVPGLLGSPLLPRFLSLVQLRARDALK